MCWQMANPDYGNFIYYPITFSYQCYAVICTHWFQDGDAGNRAITVTAKTTSWCYIKSDNISCTVLNICIGY